MAHPTVVINLAGLSSSLIGDASPTISSFIKGGKLCRLKPVLPAVTCAVQSSMLTGLTPREHGIVGNGWYNRDLAEIHFWKQSNHLVHGEKVWETARKREPSVTSCVMFWWYNMYASADYAVTPRPIYKADGRKIPDVYTKPADLRTRLQHELGPFPLFHFWGPGSSIKSSQWIADAAILTHQWHQPTLSLIYVPHLDYGLQKLGPDHPDIPIHVREIDAVVGKLIDYFDDQGVRVILLSEYGIEAVDDSVHINRELRKAGLLQVRTEQGAELLDAGASEAFAVADHQIAHVYVRASDQLQRVKSLCNEIEGVDLVLDRREQKAHAIDHERSGDLVLVSESRRWFSYDYWLDDSRAPDFARTVDIHRKPGYDPCELFVDPNLSLPKLHIAWKLLRKRLGFRTLMDVIPLDPSLVRGSHGRVDVPPDLQPVLITHHDPTDRAQEIPCQAVRDIILEHLFED